MRVTRARAPWLLLLVFLPTLADAQRAPGPELELPPVLGPIPERYDVLDLVTDLRCGALEERRRASRRLAEARVPDLHLARSALLEAMGDPDPVVRANAARCHSSSSLCPVGDPTAKALSDLLRDEDAGVREAAANSIAYSGARAELVVPGLIEALGDSDGGVQLRAILTLGDYGPGAAAATRPLVAILLDESLHVPRSCASEALGQIGAGAYEAEEALVRVLLDQRQATELRRISAWSLGQIGPPGKLAAPALARVLRDPKEDTAFRGNVALSLGQTRDPQGARVLASVQVDLARKPYVRRYTAMALTRLGEENRQQGVLWWWVLPRAFAWEITLFLVLGAGWFFWARRVPRGRLQTRAERATQFLVVGGLPALLAGAGVAHALTIPWAKDFLPEPFLAVIPRELTGILTTSFVCLMAAVWACQRPRSAAPEQDLGSGLLKET